MRQLRRTIHKLTATIGRIKTAMGESLVLSVIDNTIYSIIGSGIVAVIGFLVLSLNCLATPIKLKEVVVDSLTVVKADTTIRADRTIRDGIVARDEVTVVEGEVVTKELDEVVITPMEAVRMGDKFTYNPNKGLRTTTNSCPQLLAGLQIPELIVNPVNGTISLAGSSKLSIRVNGRAVSQSEIASIAPNDIRRVDFYPNPGVRYGNVDGVIDIIVKRRESGYGMMMNVLQSVNRGWGNYVGALKYNTGRSEWTIEYNSNPMWNMDCYRNNTEQFTLSDGLEIKRYEQGIKTPNRMVTHHASLQYSYAKGNRILFNAQGRLTRRNDRYASTGRIITEMPDEILTGYEEEIAPIKMWQGDVDLYLYYRFNKRHKVYFNIVSSIVDGKNSRLYKTEGYNIESSIVNRGCHILGEGIWEGTFGSALLTAGFRINKGWNRASYLEGDCKVWEGDCKVWESESSSQLFVEWKHSANRLHYMIGIEGSLYSVHKPVRYADIFLNPRLSISYTPFTEGTLSLSLNSFTIAPTINQLNPALQRVDLFQWSQGNVKLTPFQRLECKTGFDATFKGIAVKISFSDKYCRKPIMEIKIYEDNRIVCSYVNGGHNNDFEVRASLRIPIIDRKLTCSVEGGWHTAISKNLDYKHTYSQSFVNLQLMYMTGKWWVMTAYNNAYNQLWGETISTINRNLLNIGFGYTYRVATFSLGVVNPFGNIALKTSNLSKIASFDRMYQASDSHLLVWMGVSMNLHKGRKRSAVKKRVDNKVIYESIKNQMK